MNQEHEQTEIHPAAYPSQSAGARWSRAFEDLSRRGTEALPELMALYEDGFAFEDPMQMLRGRDAFERLNRRLLAMARDVNITMKELVERDDAFLATWSMRVTPRFGLPITIEGASHVRVHNGRIVYHRDYFDVLGSLASSIPVLPRLVRSAIGRLLQGRPAQQLVS